MCRVVESRGLSNHFRDTFGNLPLKKGLLVFGKPFLLYHRSGHFPTMFMWVWLKIKQEG